MKGVVIYDKSNDIAFLQADDELRIHLNGVAVNRGLLQPPADQRPLSRDVVMQLFSPFMTSQRFLIDCLKTAYHSVQSEDGHLFVFMQFNEYIYIAINGDGTESENFLTRKLAILRRIILFTLGPMLSELKPESLNKREERWGFIGHLLTTWCRLYNTEESFLVEAVEWLHVNPDLNRRCVGFLEYAFTAMKSKDEETIHSMLLVNNKLLSLYSDTFAPEVDVSDMMMIIILSQSLFAGSSSEGAIGHLSSSTSQISHSSGKLDRILLENSLRELSSPDVTFQSVSQELDSHRTEASTAFKDGVGRDGSDLVQSERHGEASSSSAYGSSSKVDFCWTSEDQLPHPEKLVVFLRRSSVIVPFTLRCIPLTKEMTLIFICQISRVEDSVALAKLLEVINLVLAVRWPESVGSSGTIPKILDSAVKSVMNVAQHYGNQELVTNSVQMIGEKWKEINSSTFLQRLEEAEISRELDHRVRYDLQQMCNQLLSLFNRLFFVPRALTPEKEDEMRIHLKMIQGRMRSSLYDYGKFLIVKSLNNFTLTSYLEKVPGLVHFLYVDRTENRLTTTSLAIGCDRHSHKMELLTIKRNLWNLIEQMHQNLLNGCMSTTIRKGDYYYNYCLWCEDSSGRGLTLQASFGLAQRFLLPGIIAHNFYRKLRRRCFPKEEHTVNCYELITVHTSNMPKSLMHEQRQRLVNLLLQANAVSRSPLPLF